MNSISNSNTLLKIQDLDLFYEVDFYQSDSLRDNFVSYLSHPISSLFRKKNLLHVLRSINLEIIRGDKIALIGVNGAGKTSLCRAIAGMIMPQRGSIKVQGELRAIFNPTIAILPDLTGVENAQLLAKLLYPNQSSDEVKDIVNESIEFSGLGKFAQMPFKTFSKGMQARLCLSLITARPCDFLILDEAFDGADASFQEKVSHRVLDVIKNSGASLIVSHSIEQLEGVCNRVIILSESKIVFDGLANEGFLFYQKLIAKMGNKSLYEQHSEFI